VVANKIDDGKLCTSPGQIVVDDGVGWCGDCGRRVPSAKTWVWVTGNVEPPTDELVARERTMMARLHVMAQKLWRIVGSAGD
jgi:hypothetical protein